MNKFFLSLAAMCVLASCTQIDPIGPRYASINDFGITYGAAYDFQIENTTDVLGEGYCVFVNDSLLEVFPNNDNNISYQYAFVDQSLKVFYNEEAAETLDYSETESTLSGLVTYDTWLLIFID